MRPFLVPFIMLLAASLPVRTARSEPVTGTFSGRVSSLAGYSHLLPADIHVGDAVTGTLVFDLEGSSNTLTLPGYRVHFLLSGSFAMSVQVEGYTWSIDTGYHTIDVADDGQFGDVVHWVLGTALWPSTSPNLGGGGNVGLTVEDFEAPRDLIDAAAFPPSHFADADFTGGRTAVGWIGAWHNSGLPFWEINFEVTHLALDQAVPVRATTWGRVKALLATGG
jgi:hypothetical protein